MSLNRCEQYLFEYIQEHREEGHHWRNKVLSIARQIRDRHEQAALLEGDLWAYFEERAKGSPEFNARNPAKDLRRTSMRNLSEYLLRMWVPVVGKKPVKGS